jgi:hypothetical protein
MAFIPAYILILFFTIIVDSCAGILIERAQGSARKIYLGVSIIANVGILGVFKYYAFINATDGVFTRAAFNEYGDLESHLGRPSVSRIGSVPLVKTLSEDTMQVLADFGAEAERRGARLYLAYPAFADFAYAQSPDAVAGIDAALRRRLPHATFLGPPSHFVLPRSHLFDSVYHANAAGRAVHTQRIADGIAGTGGCR